MKTCPHCKKAILTGWQDIVLQQIKQRPGITSHVLADKLKMTIPHASTVMYKLWLGRLITRKRIMDPTGGHFYEYTAKEAA